MQILKIIKNGFQHKVFITLLLLTISQPSFALSTSGKITSLVTYSTTETILVTLEDAGTKVDECSSATTFAISKSISAEARARMYAMLLSAQATGRTVTLSYAPVGSCEPWGSNTTAYRKIVRLR